jgi:hypothetical protein
MIAPPGAGTSAGNVRHACAERMSLAMPSDHAELRSDWKQSLARRKH